MRELVNKINTKTMNIQDKMQEIHHKYGVTEKANYEIQLFIENLIDRHVEKQLTSTDVSQQRELLIDFCTKLELKAKQYSYLIPDEDFIDEYLKDN